MFAKNAAGRIRRPERPRVKTGRFGKRGAEFGRRDCERLGGRAFVSGNPENRRCFNNNLAREP
jgi:hypothetical protein